MNIDQDAELGSLVTYGELSRELGFGEDWEGFVTWADAHGVIHTDRVSHEDAAGMREAMACSIRATKY